jgi:endo-beta-N-acetylglucosaminidase D
VKSKSLGVAIWSREHLVDKTRRIFEKMSKAALISIYRSWLKLVKWAIKNDEDDFY